jgi:hypothetical protein
MRFAALLFILLLIPLVNATKVDFEVERALERSDDVKVIVVLRDDMSADISEKINITHTYNEINTIAGEVTAENLEELQNNDAVKKIMLDKVFHITLNTSRDVISSSDTWSKQVNGINLTGEGVGICIIDTGIDTDHEAFAGKIVNQSCFCSVTDNGAGGCCPNNASTDSSAEDDSTSSHGSHVAGIAAGNGSTKGVAPDAHIVAVKVCNSNGDCSGSDILSGINHCVNVSKAYNVSVISISIGDNGQYNTQAACPTTFDAAINTAAGVGITTTISSGNNGHAAGISSPACSANATSVGSTTKTDGLSSFTNRGALLDVLTPGSSIVSATKNGGYGSLSGTSMSAPHAAGAAAIVTQFLELNKLNYTNTVIEDALNRTNVFVSGFPRIDVLTAIIHLSSNSTINQTTKKVSTSFASIRFHDNTTSLRRIDECAMFTNNSIAVNDSGCSEYNVSADLSFVSLPNLQTPLIFKNNVACADCEVLSFSNGILLFNVTSFSNYTTGNNSRLSIFDTTDSLERFVTENVTFTANYTNITSNLSINGSAVFCTFNSESTITNMSFNGSLYELNHSTNSSGIVDWNVTCDGNATGFETLVMTDSFNISNDTLAPSTSILVPANVSTESSSNTITFTYNTTDNLTHVNHCDLIINNTVNLTNSTLLEDVNQTFAFALTNDEYSWQVNCTDAANNTGASETFFLTVNATNNAPSADTIPNQTFSEDTTGTINLSNFFNDANALTFAASSAENITTSIAGGIATITPQGNFSGVRNVTFNATDSLGAFNTSNVVFLNVSPVNDEPFLIASIADQSFASGSSTSLNFDDYFLDIDSSLTFNASGNSVVTVEINDETHGVVLSASSVGSEIITFSAFDGVNLTYSNNVSVNVTEAVAAESSSSSSSSSSGGGGGGGGGTSSFVPFTAKAVCTDECSAEGTSCTSSRSFAVCANTDEDACLEESITTCGSGESCQDGSCVSCTPDWECTSWSSCDDGVQSRKCVDQNECGSDADIPEQGRVCEASLEGTCGDGVCNELFCVEDCKETYQNTGALVALGALTLVGSIFGYRRWKGRHEGFE